jgi:hypothetical protein
MTLQKGNTERVIDTISITGNINNSCPHSRYQRSDRSVPVDGFFQQYGQQLKDTEEYRPNRHEKYLEQLLTEFEKFKLYYPDEILFLRNVSVCCFREYSCRRFYTADIVVNTPLPESVNHSVAIELTGLSQAEVYNRLRDYLTGNSYIISQENVNLQTVTILQADVVQGSIRGIYAFNINYGTLWYVVTSNFSINIENSKVRIQFEDAKNQRPGSTRSVPIFLHSVANSAEVEIYRFTDYMVARIR